MSDSIFRPGVVSPPPQQLGQSIRWRPIRHRWLALALTFSVLCAVSGVAHLPYQQKVQVTGWAQPDLGTTAIVAPGAGRITEIAVKHGDRVVAGQVLARIDFTRLLAGGRSQEERDRLALSEQLRLRKERHAAQHQLDQIDQRTLVARYDDLESERRLLDRQIQAQAERLRIARHDYRRVARLVQARWLGRAEQTDARRLYLGELERAAQLRREASRFEADAADLVRQRQAHRERARVTQMRLAEEIVETEHLLAAAADRIEWLVAPHAGKVDDIRFEVGDRLREAAQLMALVRASNQWRVELFASPVDVGRLQRGQSVQLRFDGYPHAEFGLGRGRIDYIARVPRVSGERLHYLVAVAVTDLPRDVTRLPEGMGVAADVIVAKKPLWRWLWEPIAAMLLRL